MPGLIRVSNDLSEATNVVRWAIDIPTRSVGRNIQEELSGVELPAFVEKQQELDQVWGNYTVYNNFYIMISDLPTEHIDKLVEVAAMPLVWATFVMLDAGSSVTGVQMALEVLSAPHKIGHPLSTMSIDLTDADQVIGSLARLAELSKISCQELRLSGGLSGPSYTIHSDCQAVIHGPRVGAWQVQRGRGRTHKRDGESARATINIYHNKPDTMSLSRLRDLGQDAGAYITRLELGSWARNGADRPDLTPGDLAAVTDVVRSSMPVLKALKLVFETGSGASLPCDRDFARSEYHWGGQLAEVRFELWHHFTTHPGWDRLPWFGMAHNVCCIANSATNIIISGSRPPLNSEDGGSLCKVNPEKMGGMASQEFRELVRFLVKSVSSPWPSYSRC